jgi:heterodisulfide reductase subunit C
MDLLPNQVIRLVQLGYARAAMQCRTIWLCVGCHTCSSQCPSSIDLAAFMDALRQLAIRDGIAVPESDIQMLRGVSVGGQARHRHPHGR